MYEVPSQQHPKSFSTFDPVLVRYYKPDFGILVWKWVSKENGIYVVPAGSMRQPTNTSNVTYEKIDEGVYWYQISG